MSNPPLCILRGIPAGLANDEQRNLCGGEISRNIESLSTEDARISGEGALESSKRATSPLVYLEVGGFRGCVYDKGLPSSVRLSTVPDAPSDLKTLIYS